MSRWPSVANRITPLFGKGGPGNGTAPPLGATIVPAWRVRLNAPPANDNKPPLSRRLFRFVLYLLILAALASVFRPLLP